MFGWVRRMLRGAERSRPGWDAIHESARQHLATLSKLRETRTMRGDPVIEEEYLKAERIFHETEQQAAQARAR